MNYDVVIATRNRPQALELSIPLILGQDRKPNKLIVIDSSDDHNKVSKTIVKTVGDSQIELEILRSKANSSLQRNIGLERVESPVVMFPDDDSLWWPGVAESVMEIYERDVSEIIGGVSAGLAKSVPPHTNLEINQESKMLFKDRFRQKISGIRYRLNSKIGSDPMYVLGRLLLEKHDVPDWLETENASLTEYMTGCRMSFRTDAIRAVGGFNCDLGANVGWAAYEDADASFAVMRKYLLVKAHNAKVCHYMFPSKRAKGFSMGFINQFNRSYIVIRHSSSDSPVYRSLKRFALYKAMQYLLGVKDQYGRDRLRGHIKAMRSMKFLLESSPEDLRDFYLKQCQKVLPK